MKVNTIKDFQAQNKSPEILFWVGCAGSFDERIKKITKKFATILTKANISFAILGKEEYCTGDPAKRAGNEFLFQMQAFKNIEKLNFYKVEKIVTTCPHCFNTLKNEYPELGGNYEVVHYTVFLNSLIKEGKLKIGDTSYRGKKITFHDPCYLSRANNIYNAPREVIRELKADLVEMKKCKTKSMCCGAGGAQMFKDAEKGDKEINVARTEQALKTKSEIIATACPFCNIMLSDGVKEKSSNTKVIDLIELID